MSLFDTVVVQPIFNLLLVIYSIIPGADFGVAIIVLTIIIRFLMWPLVKKQLHQTKMMRKLQPELQRIKVKAKGNKQLEGMQMMELYKKYGVSPFRSLGILLIQLPIFIALFRVIRIFTLHRENLEMYTYGFLKHFPTISGIIKDPDTFNQNLFGFLKLTESAIGSNGVHVTLIILALIAAFTQYIVSKQTTPSTGSEKKLRDIFAEAGDGKEPDQAEMNAVMMRNMSKFMPVMMFFIMLNLPAALALYYATSNIIASLQQHYILKQDEDELEMIAAEPSKTKKVKAEKPKTSTKKTKKPARGKIASDATVTRIVAKDDRPRKKS